MLPRPVVGAQAVRGVVSTHVRRRCRMLLRLLLLLRAMARRFNPRPASLPDAAGPSFRSHPTTATGFNPRPASLPGCSACTALRPALTLQDVSTHVPASLPDAACAGLVAGVLACFNPRPASLPDAATGTAGERSGSLLEFQPTSGVAAGCCEEAPMLTDSLAIEFQPTSGVAAGCCVISSWTRIAPSSRVSTHVRRRCRMLPTYVPTLGPQLQGVSTHVRRRCRMLRTSRMGSWPPYVFQPTSGVAAGCCYPTMLVIDTGYTQVSTHVRRRCRMLRGRSGRRRQAPEPRFNPRPASLPDRCVLHPASVEQPLVSVSTHVRRRCRMLRPAVELVFALRSEFQPTSGVAAGCCRPGGSDVRRHGKPFQPTSGVAAGCCNRLGVG